MITTVSDKEIAQAATIETLRQEVTAWSITAENLEAELESKLDSDLEKIAAERYKVVPAHESMFHRWAVVAGDGTQQLYLGREAECQNMARKFAGAFLDGAYLAQQLRQEVTTWSMTVENFEAELERERIRLAACGVVAMADTPDSAAKARQMLPEYESASCDDVKRRVDECMALRAERDALAADAARWRDYQARKVSLKAAGFGKSPLRSEAPDTYAVINKEGDVEYSASWPEACHDHIKEMQDAAGLGYVVGWKVRAIKILPTYKDIAIKEANHAI